MQQTAPPSTISSPVAVAVVMPPTIAESTPPTGDDLIVLRGVSWETYDRLTEEVDNPGTRITYDRGRLILMSPSRQHDVISYLIARMIELLAVELGIRVAVGGTTTHKSAKLEQGFEPDSCFFIANASAMRGRREWVAGVDPPPDLAVEVDLTHGPDEKLSVYAAFGVPEIWRWRDQRLEVLRLKQDATYVVEPQSTALPQADLTEMQAMIAKWPDSEEFDLISEYSANLRRRFRS